jgi:hypothetical protein
MRRPMTVRPTGRRRRLILEPMWPTRVAVTESRLLRLIWMNGMSDRFRYPLQGC